MRFFVTLACVFCVISGIKAERVCADTSYIDNYIVGCDTSNVDEIPSSFLERIDYFYTDWYKHKLRENGVDEDNFIVGEPVTCSDSVYLSRLDSLNSAIPLTYNEIVKNYIELYVVKRRTQVANMLGLSEYYFPIFEEALDAQGLPLELKFLPIIESALNPVALSRAGACGLWQFMYNTGKLYKLDVNSYVDQRRDPYLATNAAVTYLRDMYAIYEDWLLVIAAYNCGPGNVNKAIRRAGGGKKTYWDIYYNLPTETRGYVPAFIGAMYAFNYYKEHGILPLDSPLPPLCDTILIHDGLHFNQIAAKIDMSVEELRDLNPQFRLDVIPAGMGHDYALMLPYQYVSSFIDNQDSIFAYQRKTYFNDELRTADPKARVKVLATSGGASIGNKVKLIHVVKSGEVPGGISSKYGVTLSDLRYWNNLNRRLTIRPGQKLVVYVSEKKAEQFKGSSKYAGKVSNNAEAPTASTSGFVTYIVRSGDSLWSIAKKYPGVSDRDIMSWNGLKSTSKLSIGQKLKIKI